MALLSNSSGLPTFMVSGNSGREDIFGMYFFGIVTPDGYGVYDGINSQVEFDEETQKRIAEWISKLVSEGQFVYPHDWKDADCENPSTCRWCNAQGDDLPLGHTTDNGICERCGESVFVPIEYSGSGDSVISNIELSDYIYLAKISHSGNRNFIMHTYYDNDEEKGLLVNTIGDYDGTVLLPEKLSLTFNIQADGDWNITISRIETTTDTKFYGKGDYVTPICIGGATGAYKFTHDGSHNFIVKMISDEGGNLVINKIGEYDGVQMIQATKGNSGFFVITADGNWSIEKQER